MAQANEIQSRPANIAFFVDDTPEVNGDALIIGESYYQ